jgi:hypothetical protein
MQITFHNFHCYVRVKSNRDQATLGEFDFWKNNWSNARQNRQKPQSNALLSPVSGILAKIQLNKYFKIKKNEK